MSLPKSLLLISIIWMGLPLKAQEQFFNELGLSKNYTLKKNDINFNLSSSFKYQIKTDAKWKQMNIGGEFSKFINQNWKPFVGLINFYTTQDNNDNYYEIRPYLGFILHNMTIKKLMFQQRFKYEIRNTIFNRKENNSIQNRIRYKISLDYKLNGKHPKKINYWSLNTGYEWYFVGKPNAGEQFSANREFHFSATKRTLKNTSFTLNYQFFVLNIFKTSDAGDAHTLTFTYNF